MEVEQKLPILPMEQEVWEMLAQADVEALTLYMESHAGSICSQRDEKGYTALQIAALFGHVEIVELLLLNDSSPDFVNAIDSYGFTAAHLAANEGYVEVLQRLVEAQALLDLTSKDLEFRLSGIPIYYTGGRTPLHLAAEKNNPQAVQYLAETFPQLVPLEDFAGLTAARLAMIHNHQECGRLLDSDIQEISQKERMNINQDINAKCRERLQVKHLQDSIKNLQNVKDRYTPLHSVFYDYGFTRDMFEPAFLEAMDNGSPEAMMGVLQQLNGDSGVYVFPMMKPEFCEMLLQECLHYESQAEALNLPITRPNSMNNYGVVLNHIGLQPAIHRLLRAYVQPMTTLFFPSVGELQSHHSFYIRYKEGEDLDLATHVDQSDVTLNLCLGREFTGAVLYFHSVKNAAEDQEKGRYASPHMLNVCEHCKIHYNHIPGYALIHLGNHIHGADKIETGERGNLIIWARTRKYN